MSNDNVFPPKGEERNSTFHPLDRSQGNIRIGVGDTDGAAWEPVMLHEGAATELRGLWAIVTKLEAFLGNATHLENASWNEAAVELGKEIGDIRRALPSTRGGTPSAGFQCRARSGG